MFLQCKDHEKMIIQIDSAQDAKQGSRAKCEKCTMSGTLVHIEVFEKTLNEKVLIAEQMEKDNQQEFEKLSNPLEKLLTNYKYEFNSTIGHIYQEVQNIKHKIHEHFSIMKKPLESQSRNEFEQICHKVYSNFIQQFHLKSQYSNLITIIQNLIKLENCYSQKITKCFKQLQNDMINYELQYTFNVPGPNCCTAMCTGQDSDGQLVALALGNVLKTYEYCLEKKKAVEKQSFNDFTHNIGSIVFSEDYKYLIVGGTYDNKMNIYTEQCKTKKMYELKTKIIYQEPIFSIIFTPNNEDLISASGNDIFCIKNEDIKYIVKQEQQEIKKIEFTENSNNYKLETSHSNTVYQLSHYQNKSKQKFISCSYDKSIFIWLKQVDKWDVINKIRIKNSVFRCCLFDEDNIVVQENSSRDLTFYDNVSNKQQCKIDTKQQCKFYDLNTDLSHNFPMIYLEHKNLLIVKHNSKIVFFRKRKNGLFYKEDEKDGEMGTVTPDGQIFLKWDKINSKVEIYKQTTKFQVPKEEFDSKYFDSQAKIFQDSNCQSIKDQKSEYIGNTNSIKENQQKEIQDFKVLQSNDIVLQLKKDIEFKGINTDDQKPILYLGKSNTDDQQPLQDNIRKSETGDQKPILELEKSNSPPHLVKFSD